MKLYEYIREENTRFLKILGIPVLEQTSDYMTDERIQKFLNGIVTTIKITDPITVCIKKDVQVLGHSILKRNEEKNYRNYYFFNKEVVKISILKKFKRQYFKYFNQNYDDIYILQANSGEIYLLLTYIIDTLMKKNQSKAPLLVATKNYHVDIIRMVCPDLPYVYIKNFNLNITGSSFNIDKFRFILLFDSTHFKQTENSIKDKPIGEVHYFQSIMDKLNIIKDEISMRKIKIPTEDTQHMKEKVSKIGLNLDKFIFIAPEAQSCKLYDEDFWCSLINSLQDKGYDVFVNLVSNDIKLKGARGFKTCKLSYVEAFALAKHSKKIVSLRSGFTEFLLQTGVPMDILYTKFRHRHFFDDMDIYHVISGFGITEIPYIDKTIVREFNTFETSPSKCIETIIGDIE